MFSVTAICRAQWDVGACIVLCVALLATPHASARPLPAPVAHTAQVEVAFTPGEDISGKIVRAIQHAQQQILVQAFSFTHAAIARALLEARQRGIDVQLIADRKQTEALERSQIPSLAYGGVPVWLDDNHQSAHNKVMVIDAETDSALVITGSFNFTHAAQYNNAENVVFIRGNNALAQKYVHHWQKHRTHAHPLNTPYAGTTP